ncbi:hypothetical protein D3C71_1283160 [compost metagenome]
MVLPASILVGPDLTILTPDLLITSVVTSVEITGGLPGSDGVIVALLISCPLKPASIVPLMVMLTSLAVPAGISAETVTVFPVPLIPELITALPALVAVQLTSFIPVGTTSLI